VLQTSIVTSGLRPLVVGLSQYALGDDELAASSRRARPSARANWPKRRLLEGSFLAEPATLPKAALHELANTDERLPPPPGFSPGQ